MTATSRSSSGGESRVTRAAYGGDDLYTLWARQSLAAWRELERDAGRRLFHGGGVLWMAGEA